MRAGRSELEIRRTNMLDDAAFSRGNLSLEQQIETITFIIRLMHSVIQNLEVKIYVV